MAKYKRKKEIVDAIQWNGTEKSCHEVVAFCKDIFWSPPDIIVLDCAEGSIQVYKDDYIVRDINGEFYVHSAEDFEDTYKLIK